MSKRKVFGVGLNKTGSTTLGRCLTTLGYRHQSFNRELALDYRNGNISRILRFCDEHDSFEDWPFPLIFRELLERYGDSARFVLTTRASAEIWVRSLKNHALRTHPTQHARLIVYGYAYPHGFERQHIERYDSHNKEVARHFESVGRERLLKTLCWEAGDGWDELCAFLDEPRPGTPFPHENRMDLDAIRESPFFEENSRYVRNQLELLGLDPNIDLPE